MSSNLIARSIFHEGLTIVTSRPSSLFAEVAQLVEHATENCGVASSSLALGTFLYVLVIRLDGEAYDSRS